VSGKAVVYLHFLSARGDSSYKSIVLYNSPFIWFSSMVLGVDVDHDQIMMMISGYTHLASWPSSHLKAYYNHLRHLTLPKVR